MGYGPWVPSGTPPCIVLESPCALVAVLELVDEEVRVPGLQAGRDATGISLHEVAHDDQQVVEVAGIARLEERLIGLIDLEVLPLDGKGVTQVNHETKLIEAVYIHAVGSPGRHQVSFHSSSACRPSPPCTSDTWGKASSTILYIFRVIEFFNTHRLSLSVGPLA